jgi:uncharacterized protein (TIGR00297 family)
MPERTLAGLLAAGVAAGVARRAGSLSASGALAAVVVGTAAVSAGWRWALLLLLFFGTSVLLSRVGAASREARTGAIVAKGGPRDATQVLANGGVFAALALMAADGGPVVVAAAAGALAAATADTWATEAGTLSSAPPRSLIGFAPVAPGTSGGVSVPGTLALLAGAGCLAMGAMLLDVTRETMAVVAGGVAGAMADSLLGATVQQRRWCEACERWTERRVHGCGAPTRHAAGLAWLDNDAVNLAATLVGAGTAAAVAAIS